GDDVVRAFVFFPWPYFGTEVGLEQLHGAIHFEARRDVRDIAFRGNYDAERALALAPAHADEIEHARRAFHEDRVDLLLRHQLLRARDARFALRHADRHDAVGHRLERGDRRVKSGVGRDDRLV